MKYICAVIILCMMPTVKAAETLQVAVASNFIGTARQLANNFESESGIRVLLSSASTGKIYTQILHGAPYDVFMAADSARPALLEENEMIVNGSRKTYAIGALVFWSTKSDKDCLSLLKQVHFDRLAIASPEIAPYGAAARATLKALDLWSEVGSKLVRAENIGQTMAFLKAGAADAGFIARSQAIHLNAGCQWQVPKENHQPLDQQMVILSDSKKQPAARMFAQYLGSVESLKIIHRNGYRVP